MSFPHKKKLKEFVNTKPVLQQMLKGLLGGEEEGGGGGEEKGKKQENSLTIKWHYLHIYQ